MADARAAAAEREAGGALALGGDLDGEVGFLAEALDHGARVDRLHHAVDRLPAPVRCPVGEDGHDVRRLPA